MNKYYAYFTVKRRFLFWNTWHWFATEVVEADEIASATKKAEALVKKMPLDCHLQHIDNIGYRLRKVDGGECD